MSPELWREILQRQANPPRVPMWFKIFTGAAVSLHVWIIIDGLLNNF